MRLYWSLCRKVRGQSMLSNCHECGTPLTIKEAGENRCGYCSRAVAKATVAPRPFERHRVNLSFVRENFDLMVADELRKRNSPNH
jgi:uncharacterized Zn finger protein (UPF0148 family)